MHRLSQSGLQDDGFSNCRVLLFPSLICRLPLLSPADGSSGLHSRCRICLTTSTQHCTRKRRGLPDDRLRPASFFCAPFPAKDNVSYPKNNRGAIPGPIQAATHALPICGQAVAEGSIYILSSGTWLGRTEAPDGATYCCVFRAREAQEEEGGALFRASKTAARCERGRPVGHWAGQPCACGTAISQVPRVRC